MTCWLDALQPGDVVRFRSGALRTCMRVNRSHGEVRGAWFPILRCSWTTRGHTVIGRTDLLQRAECITRAKINLSRYPVARALLEDLHGKGAYHADGASCCDVIGVFE